jgi:hypothetical protein
MITLQDSDDLWAAIEAIEKLDGKPDLTPRERQYLARAWRFFNEVKANAEAWN